MRRETTKTDAKDPFIQVSRKGWLEVDLRRLCTRCKQRKEIKGGRYRPFVCAECK